MARGLLPLLLAAATAALVLFGVVLVGRATRAGERPRAVSAFAAIDCDPPPGLDRREFLDEVQYLGGFPDELHLLDAGLAERLAEGFARHPWVEKVERVEVQLSRGVHVRLAHRTPVLAISHGGRLRAVDANGVLLPARASTQGLPRFQGTARPPSGPAGTRWGDAAVEEAAARAGAGAP
jgi:hypothetical protein